MADAVLGPAPRRGQGRHRRRAQLAGAAEGSSLLPGWAPDSQQQTTKKRLQPGGGAAPSSFRRISAT
eukprot:11707247-Alexandrium_andersonii.AAC.1